MRLPSIVGPTIFLWGLMLFFIGPADGQDSVSFEDHFSVFSWPKDAGLPKTIQSMAQGSDGFLWMGCDYGIVRFDGFTRTLFDRRSVPELTTDDCQAIYLARDSTLYFGFVGGLLASYRDGQFRQVGDTGSFRGESIYRICEDSSGDIWIGTDGNGLFEYSGDKFKHFTEADGLPANGIDALCAGDSGDVWVGTSYGLCLIHNGVIKQVTDNNNLSFNGISALHMDHGGTLWIGGFSGGLMKYHKGEITTIRNAMIPVNSSINTITSGPDGLLWIATAKEGLVIYNQRDNTSFKITQASGLSRDMIRCLVNDREGNILVGTEDGGLNRIKKALLKSYTTKDGLSHNNVMSLFTNSDGRIWIGCVDGSICYYENKTFRNISDKFDIQSPPVFSITALPGNKIWVAPFGDLIAYDGIQREVFPVGEQLKNNMYHAVYGSRDGTVWAGTDAGICLLKNGIIKTLTRKDGLTDGRIYCFEQDHTGRMWIGTQDGGINIYSDGKVTSITSKEGLSDNLILCFYEDQGGSMWVGTGHNGMNRIDGESGVISQINSAIGYPRSVTYIAEDLNGNLWLGTNKGITSVRRTDIEAYINGELENIEVRHFGRPEGMSDDECTAGTFPGGCWTPDNKIWFATPGGITEVDPLHTAMPAYFPYLFIQDLFVNGKSAGSNQSYNLPAGVIQLEIQYSAPSFIAPDKLQFRYQLEGYDKSWVDAGSRRSAFYTKVPPGDYRFRVQVCTHLGQWSEQEASTVIHVNYYFYQTVWFLLLCIFVGLFVIYAIVRYRIRYIREKELEILVDNRTSELKELNRDLDKRVLDRTAELAAANQELEAFTYSVSHDLRAPVRRIEGLVEALVEEHSSNLDDTGKDFLSKVADSSVEMGQLIEEFLKLARIARQEIDKTELNLSKLVEEVLDDIAAADPERKVIRKVTPGILASGDPRLIRIALQNLLGNAWKYTGKTDQPEIIFDCLEKEGQKVFFIRDNGVGFDMGHYEKLFTPFLRLHSDDQFTGTGIGLATVKRIMLKHGGKIWAQAEPGKGSTFFFTL